MDEDHCVTCDAALAEDEGHPVLSTFLQADRKLPVSDVLERCLLLTDVSRLTSDVICKKCFVLLEDYCQLEIKYRDLRNMIWKMHVETVSNRNLELSDLICGVQVQTDETSRDIQIESIQEKTENDQDDSDHNMDENITVDADPQYESDSDEVAPTKEVESNSEKFCCKACGLLLATEEALKVHRVVANHFDDEQNVGGDDEGDEAKKTKIKCEVCCRSFVNFAGFRKHVNSEHQNHKFIYKCRTCYKELTTHGGAAYHGRSHYVGGDEPSIEEIFEFLVQPSTSPVKKRPYSSNSHIKLNLGNKNIEPKKSNKVVSEVVIKEEVHMKDEPVVLDDESSDDELPLATQRKQIIFEKIKEEVFTNTQKTKGPTNKTAKKALAELKKINGIVIEKVKKEESRKRRVRYAEVFDRMMQKQNPKATVRSADSGDDGIREVRLPPIKEAKFECEFCHKKWRSRGELNAHVSTHSDARPFICEVCGQAYKHKHALDVHVGMHKGIYHHQCPFCKKAFTQKGALQRHLPIHTGDLPFQCELCGKRFVHRTSFSIHTMAHTGVRNIKCQVCNLGVLSKSHLRRHMRIHSGEKPYECGECGKSFAERYNLVAHRRTHDPLAPAAAPRPHQRKQPVCRLCNAIFSNKRKLEEHMVDHHNKVTEESANSRPSVFETNEAYLPALPSRFAINEPESDKSALQRAEDGREEPTAELLARRNMQALRNVDLLRASVDGQLVRLSAGMIEPSHAWAYLNHAT